MPSFELVKRNGQRQNTRLAVRANLGLMNNREKDGIAYVQGSEAGHVSIDYADGSRVFLTSRLVDAIKNATIRD